MRMMGNDFSIYLESLALFAWIGFLDFNLPNYSVNRSPNPNDISFFLGTIVWLVPILGFVAVATLTYQGFTIIYLVAVTYTVFLTICGVFAGFIKRYYSFEHAHTISVAYNAIAVIVLLIVKPADVHTFLTIKLYLVLALFIVYFLLIINKVINTQRTKRNLNGDTSPLHVLLSTREYTAQRCMDFISANFVGLVLVPIEPIYALSIYVYRTIFNLPVALSGILAQLFQQLKIESGINIDSGRFYNLIMLCPAIALLLLVKYQPIENLISNYWNLMSSVKTVDLVLVWGWSVLLSFSKKYYMQRQVGGKSMSRILLFAFASVIFVFLLGDLEFGISSCLTAVFIMELLNIFVLTYENRPTK
jgi:hypothetical protein